MPPVRDRPRTAAGVLLVAAGGLAALAVYLWRLGPERASQVSGVLALFASLLSMSGGILTLLWPAPGRGGVRLRRVRRLRTAWGVRRLDEELCRLLEAVRSQADVAPYPSPDGGHAALSSIYVQQRLELQPDEEAGWDRDVARREPPRGRDKGIRPVPVSLPLERVLAEHRHLLLEGGPGAGKSTTARQVCRQLALAWLAGGPARPPLADPVLPLLVSARGLAGQRGLPWPQALARTVSAELGLRLGSELPAELVAEPAAGACWLVVVDGLDEVPLGEREELLAMLADRAALGPSPYRLLVTSRPLTGPARAGLRAGEVGHYSLVPFDRAALVAFARSWFRGADGRDDGQDGEGRSREDDRAAGLAAGFAAEVRAAGLDRVAAVPLLAMIAISVYSRAPTRQLPRNRHDLYEEYLTHLWEAGHTRRQALWQELAGRLDAVARGRRGRGLLEQLDALVERLAVVRLDSRDPLLPAALAWLADRGLSPHRRPAAWARWIADLLATTGVLVVRGEDVEFVHQSFAEHYAARVHARALPPEFDGGHDGWRRWVARTLEGEPVGLAVLTTWTRRHDGTALLAWLLAGSTDYQQVALRLVSEGLAAEEDALARCLHLVEHIAWNNRLFFDVETLFGLVRRLPPGPLVTGWLTRIVERSTARPAVLAHAAELLADRCPDRGTDLVARLAAALPNADTLSRPAVATVLVRLAPARRVEAVAALAELMADPGLDQSRRRLATSALAELGPDALRLACDALHEVLHDTRAEPQERADAARSLVELDGSRRAETATVLDRMIRDQVQLTTAVVNAARVLVAVAPDRAGDVAAILTGIAARPGPGGTPVIAARALAALGPRFRPAGIAALLAILRAPLSDTSMRWLAADELCDYDGAYRQEALDALLAILLDPQEEKHRRHNVRVTVGGLDAEERARVAARLRPALRSRDRPAAAVREVAGVLARIDPSCIDDCAAAFDSTLRDPLCPADELSDAASSLARLGPQFGHRAAEALTAVADDPRLRADERCLGAACLSRVGPEYAAQARAVLKDILADPHSRPDDLVIAADELLRCGPDARQRGASALLKVLADPATQPADRNAAQVYLLHDMSDYRQQVAGIYQDRLSAGVAEPAQAVDLAAALAGLGPDYQPAAAAALRSVLDEPYTTAEERHAAAENLAGLGPDHRDTGVSALRAVATDPDAAPATRLAAVTTLLTIDHDQRSAGAAVLATLAHDARVAATERVAAARAMADLEPHQREHAADALRQVLADPDTTADDRHAAYWGLGELGHDDTLGGLADLLTDPELASYDRLAAARAVSRLPPADRQPALAMLSGVVTDTRTAATQRVAAATALLVLEPGHRAAVLAALWQTVDDPHTTVDARRTALHTLLTVGGPADRDRIRDLLAQALQPPAATADPPTLPALDRVTAAELIFDTAARARADAANALQAVLSDPTECQRERLRAAHVLARGGLADRAAAADTLLAWLDQPHLDTSERCTLAAEIHAISPRRAQPALDQLHAVLTGPSSLPGERWQAAGTILRCHPSDAAAARSLTALLDDPAAPAALRHAAAETLVSGIPTHRRLAANHLRRLTAGASGPEQVRAAELLTRASPADHPAAVATLGDTGTRAHHAETRLNAGTALTSLPQPAAAARGDTVLRALLHDPTQPAHRRRRAATALAAHPGPARGPARATLLAIAEDTTLDPTDQVAAACHLARSPGPTRTPARQHLHDLLTDPNLPPHLALDAIQALDPHAGEPTLTARLHAIAADKAVHPCLRCRALQLLAAGHTPASPAAIHALWTALTDPTATPDHRRWAAESLAAADNRLRTPATNALRRIAADLVVDERTRRRVRRSIEGISRGQRSPVWPR